MGRTCGEPDEIGLTAMGVELNGARQVLWWQGGQEGGRPIPVQPDLPLRPQGQRLSTAPALATRGLRVLIGSLGAGPLQLGHAVSFHLMSIIDFFPGHHTLVSPA